MLRKLFFNLWYYLRPPWDTGITPPEVMSFIENHPPGRFLDLGCGTGTNVVTLARHGWEACGVDFVPRAIRIARRRARQAQVKVQFYVEDVTQLESITGKFDLILDMGCFHSLSPQGRLRYLDHLEDLLAPGGTYLLYVFFNTDPVTTGSGVTEADIEFISRRLKMIAREDSTERGMRPSAWLTYEMEPKEVI